VAADLVHPSYCSRFDNQKDADMPAVQPTEYQRKTFLDTCAAAIPGLDAGTTQRVRCIGWDQETSEVIAQLVVDGEKVGTFSLPWLHARNPELKPEIGEYIIQTTFDGAPKALLRTVGLELLTFKNVDASYTVLDGPGVRDLEVWRGVHTKHWNTLLGDLGKTVEDDMPVVVERFVCVYPKG
jgi:uncharacterized protein YhfF